MACSTGQTVLAAGTGRAFMPLATCALGEPCDANAVLHDYCREDYEHEQRMKRIAGKG